jgi:hypothetical protein
MAKPRQETDSLGVVEAPADKLWGAQTQRSLEHFSIGKDLMPREMITAYATLKKAAAAFAASLVVGLVITPVARRSHVPFAAIGFASVVSMILGVYLFKMAGGILQIASTSSIPFELISATVADGVTALIITLGMSFGLIVPKLAIDRLWETSSMQ